MEAAVQHRPGSRDAARYEEHRDLVVVEADPNLARTTDGVTPVYFAAQEGTSPFLSCSWQTVPILTRRGLMGGVVQYLPQQRGVI